jgi:hypothetical protein
MKAACGLYDQLGCRRCPHDDLRAADILGLTAGVGEVGVGEVKVSAVRLDRAST